jgi:phosphate:Na+ symporter
MTEVILLITAGLVLFLYAVFVLSKTLKEILGDKAKFWISKFTNTTFSSILVGIVATTLLDSSSAVIIIAIVFINSELLGFRQAMGIVLGANIGTTISSQIIAMDIGKFSPIFLLLGFILIVISKTDNLSNIGKVVLYFGVLFFGLLTMENAVEPLKENIYFTELLKKADDPLTGSIMGAIITLIIQSSSATVGMAIILTKKGFLSIAGGIAIMLGAELGTCSDTLLATIKGSRAALKTGIFHLVFNFITILFGLIFFQPFLAFVMAISEYASVERTVANAHVLFNVLGVLIFVWTIPIFEKLLNRILPDKSLS